MKKIICALLTTAVVLAATPAYASNDDAAWFLGGVVGGFVLNNLTRPGRPVYGYQEPIPYYQPQPVYQKVCNRITVSRWDKRLHRRVFWYEKQCMLVPVY
jgi:hypothetical protein